jgi:hypothetical protein
MTALTLIFWYWLGFPLLLTRQFSRFQFFGVSLFFPLCTGMTFPQVIKDFDLPSTTLELYPDVVKALNKLGFTHTNFTAPPRLKPLDIVFNPWTMEVIRGPHKGKVIQNINGLCYKDFFRELQPYIPPSCASRYHMKFVTNLLRFSFPETLHFHFINGDSNIITNNTTNKLYDPQNDLPVNTSIRDNHLYIKNFAEDMSPVRQALERVRDDFGEWVIHVGGGGRREEIAKVLIAFFNPNDVRKDLYKSTIRRPKTVWNTGQCDATNTTFGQFAFQGLTARLPTYQGKIKLIIGAGVGSASYIFTVFMLLLGGKWRIVDNTYILSRKSSRVQMIARSDFNRVSNRYNGEDGGHSAPCGLKRPNITWDNPQQHLIGYFLVGRKEGRPSRETAQTHLKRAHAKTQNPNKENLTHNSKNSRSGNKSPSRGCHSRLL